MKRRRVTFRCRPCPLAVATYRQTATSSRPVTAFLAARGKDKEFFPVQPDHLFGRFDEYAVPIGVIGCVYFRAVQLQSRPRKLGLDGRGRGNVTERSWERRWSRSGFSTVKRPDVR